MSTTCNPVGVGNSRQRSGRFLDIIGWDPRVCKSNRLHVDILRFSYTILGYILWIPLKWSVIFLQSWTSTGYFSNSTGSSVTNCRFTSIIDSRVVTDYAAWTLYRQRTCSRGCEEIHPHQQCIRSLHVLNIEGSGTMCAIFRVVQNMKVHLGTLPSVVFVLPIVPRNQRNDQNGYYTKLGRSHQYMERPRVL